MILWLSNSTPPARVEIGEADRSKVVTSLNLFRLEAGVRVVGRLVEEEV